MQSAMNQRNKQRHVFTVSHQNGFSSSIQSASNLSLVRIRYLYADSIYRALRTKFPQSEGLGSGAGGKSACRAFKAVVLHDNAKEKHTFLWQR